jgi:hypothetical protein
MNELIYREEMMWMQRSRVDWLREGDRNTKFFHSRAVWRARKNRIKRLCDDEGTWHENHASMGQVATSYFQKLFTADPSLNADPIIQLIEPKVGDEINGKLCADFSDKEIADALFQLGPLKAPGKDGFPARFLQRNWLQLKEEVMEGVKEFFRSGVMPPGVNETVVVLIPKVDEPKRMMEFRPISLCNVIYKVVSKCLVNRLRPVLGEIISPEQSAFVPGRLITDNALIAFECSIIFNRRKIQRRVFVLINWTNRKHMIVLIGDSWSGCCKR